MTDLIKETLPDTFTDNELTQEIVKRAFDTGSVWIANRTEEGTVVFEQVTEPPHSAEVRKVLCGQIKDLVRTKFNLPPNYYVDIQHVLGLWKACWWEPKGWWKFWKRSQSNRIIANSLPGLLEEVQKEYPMTATSWD